MVSSNRKVSITVFCTKVGEADEIVSEKSSEDKSVKFGQ